MDVHQSAITHSYGSTTGIAMQYRKGRRRRLRVYGLTRRGRSIRWDPRYLTRSRLGICCLYHDAVRIRTDGTLASIPRPIRALDICRERKWGQRLFDVLASIRFANHSKVLNLERSLALNDLGR